MNGLEHRAGLNERVGVSVERVVGVTIPEASSWRNGLGKVRWQETRFQRWVS